jgi:hypothetical protein
MSLRRLFQQTIAVVIVKVDLGSVAVIEMLTDSGVIGIGRGGLNDTGRGSGAYAQTFVSSDENSLTKGKRLVCEGVDIAPISWDLALTDKGFISRTRLLVPLVDSLFETCKCSLNPGHKRILLCHTGPSPAVRNPSISSDKSQRSVPMIAWSSFAKPSGPTSVAARASNPFSTVVDTGSLSSRCQ